jgi:hypothetical protein
MIPPPIAALLSHGLVERTPALDEAIAKFATRNGPDDLAWMAAATLYRQYGMDRGIAVGFLSYDVHFLNWDPVVGFVAIADERRLSGRITSGRRGERVTFELAIHGTTDDYTVEIDECLDEVGRRVNDALGRFGRKRRIHQLATGSDYYAFLACTPEVASSLRATGTDIWLLPWTRADAGKRFDEEAARDPAIADANDWSDMLP